MNNKGGNEIPTMYRYILYAIIDSFNDIAFHIISLVCSIDQTFPELHFQINMEPYVKSNPFLKKI